jgi:CxxC-x17-CxxC domain-containing protein
MEEKVEEKQEDSSFEDKKPEEKSDKGFEKEDRKMYKAVCSDCGKDCEVPFEPEEGKPVRCQDCYRKNRPQKKRFNQGFQKRTYDATCAKCGKECEVPFKPNGKKPVLCRECYGKSKE